MKKVLYITNIEVPYRVEFFNQLSLKCDLTVLYERKKSSNRNIEWSRSINSNYKIKYLRGINFNNEYKLSLSILKYAFSKEYDKIIIGCYNSPSQMMMILLMRMFKKKYILNVDGEYFIDGKGIKKSIKRFLLRGAEKYLVAGEKSAKRLSNYVSNEKIETFYFSSMTKDELNLNRQKKNENINNYILVVGQFYNYKGLDIALEVAKLNTNLKYKFVGAGKRSNLLIGKVKEMNLKNVEVISFLEKKDLEKEYQNCKMLLLPTRYECWGLVINEAASFGCPIVSTTGSGAAEEFLDGKFSKYLVNSNDALELYEKIQMLINDEKEIEEYKNFLIEKSSNYYIERNVNVVVEEINKE